MVEYTGGRAPVVPSQNEVLGQVPVEDWTTAYGVWSRMQTELAAQDHSVISLRGIERILGELVEQESVDQTSKPLGRSMGTLIAQAYQKEGYEPSKARSMVPDPLPLYQRRASGSDSMAVPPKGPSGEHGVEMMLEEG